MAVAFGSAGTFLTYGSHTNSTLVAPASIADGDLLLAFLFTGAGGSAPTTTPPAGWTALTGSPTSVGDGGFFGKYNIFYKIAASEAGNYIFTHTAASSCGIVARYTGVDTATPFSPTPTVNTGTGTPATATGFTTTVANTFIIFTEHDWGANTTDCTPPAGSTPAFMERLDTLLIYIADGTLASAGATGNKSHTPNNVGGLDPWGAYLIGLNPSGGGGVAPVTFNANPGSYTLTGTPAALGRQIINVGSAINDGTGDLARVAFTKCNSNFADLYAADTTFLTTTAAATTYQPLDADLTAIAALTGTNTIYYRSAANTWAPVTIGTNLTFSGGTLAASGGAATPGPPQGRLTLQTAVPVMTTTQAAKTTIFYTPYNGNKIPIWDGGQYVQTTFAEISTTTTDTTKNPAAVGASQVHDWFVWNDAGTIRLCHGPAWVSDTARSLAIGMIQGILVTGGVITNGPTANQGTYVGTTRSNASSQLDWIYGGLAAGGTAGFFGVWNGYNRVNVANMAQDNTDSWTYATAVWRAANNSATMRVSFVVGLQEDAFAANYHAIGAGPGATVGVGYDVTNAFSGTTGYTAANAGLVPLFGQYSVAPAIGFHFVSAIEYAFNGSSTFYGDVGVAFLQTGLWFSFRM